MERELGRLEKERKRLLSERNELDEAKEEKIRQVRVENEVLEELKAKVT